jgi:hypothetical protein
VLNVIDRISISSPNAAINEDAVGATSSAAWAIDGATGVSERPPLVAGTTDAAWLAGALDAALHAAFAAPQPEPTQTLAGVEAKLRTDFLAVDRTPVTAASDQPTAALAVAALQEETLHLLGIGDCRMIYQEHTGAVGEFNPSRIGPVEVLIIGERRRLMKQYPGEDPWPLSRPSSALSGSGPIRRAVTRSSTPQGRGPPASSGRRANAQKSDAFCSSATGSTGWSTSSQR